MLLKRILSTGNSINNIKVCIDLLDNCKDPDILDEFLINVFVDNLRTECLNGYRSKYDYRYIFMFDLEKEDIKNFYPNDKLKKFFEYVLLKNSTLKKQNK